MALIVTWESIKTECTLGRGVGDWRLSAATMTLVSIPNVPWGCVTEAIEPWARRWLVAEVLNSELPHLVNEIQTQPLWLKPISTTEWMKPRRFWMYSCHITWDISSRRIVRYPRIVNNIIKAKGVCRTTFGKKTRKLWVCQWIIKVIKAILWS